MHHLHHYRLRMPTTRSIALASLGFYDSTLRSLAPSTSIALHMTPSSSAPSGNSQPQVLSSAPLRYRQLGQCQHSIRPDPDPGSQIQSCTARQASQGCMTHDQQAANSAPPAITHGGMPFTSCTAGTADPHGPCDAHQPQPHLQDVTYPHACLHRCCLLDVCIALFMLSGLHCSQPAFHYSVVTGCMHYATYLHHCCDFTDARSRGPSLCPALIFMSSHYNA